MKIKTTLHTIAFFIVVLTILCPAMPDQNPALAEENKPNGSEAKAAATKWLGGLDKKGLVLNQRVKERGFIV
ncbi:hypothetical protein N9Z99_04610, partial [Akkermansiaceae bacterium]|nr:hypothetical protein [Akkermansiaceae bacterium]